ncbi:hypothetical protein [Cryobacterium sp. Y57]|uniref:hypothetical protein n=1 Tax=Cryobacterium sp. Y57 TaxID=2048287 RepID=UPI000CE3E6AF|nr:hypothetical protein [Cryobacterium sp. Y57]
MKTLFPPTTGKLCAVLRTALTASPLAYASGVTVGPELPATKTARMVTVRDDSGPDDGVQTRRRYGINVWARRQDAELLALLCMAVLRSCADGQPITATDSFSGPYSIPDDPAYVVGNEDLVHFFFTFRVSARGVDY